MGKFEEFKRLARIEIQTEMIACTHIVVMLFVFALEQFLYNGGAITFWQLLQMSLLGYGSAWGQQLLFWGDKIYSRTAYCVRAVCWIGLPWIITMISGICLGWFAGEPWGYEWFFYGFMLFYYVMFWVLLQVFFKKDSKELNHWLEEYKKE